MKNCACDSGLMYSNCCGLYITEHQLPPTPLALMRSRYTAYTQANIPYIQRTMQGAALKDFEPNHAESWAKTVKWLGLKILHAAQNQDHGEVEFIAYYSHHNVKHEIHELSEFVRIDGQWLYIDGKLRAGS